MLLLEVCREIFLSVMASNSIVKGRFCTWLRRRLGRFRLTGITRLKEKHMIKSRGVWGGKDIAGISQMLQDQGRPPEELGCDLGCG